MKKLMFAATMVAGVALTGYSLESANCVGYMANENMNMGGNTLMGPVFSSVGQQDVENGTGTIDVQAIVPVGENVPNGETQTVGVDTISLQKLNATGGIDGDLLIWRDSGDEQWKIGKQGPFSFKGWYIANDSTAKTGYTINAGQAVWVNIPTGASCSLQSAGEVAAGDIYMQLNQGNTAACNPMPVTLDVQKIVPYGIGGAKVPNGETQTAGVDTISLQKLNATGGIDGDLLLWRDSGDEQWKIGKQGPFSFKGWYIANDSTPKSEYNVTAGQGLWVNCPNATTALVFPSVFEKDAE